MGRGQGKPHPGAARRHRGRAQGHRHEPLVPEVRGKFQGAVVLSHQHRHNLGFAPEDIQARSEQAPA